MQETEHKRGEKGSQSVIFRFLVRLIAAQLSDVITEVIFIIKPLHAGRV